MTQNIKNFIEEGEKELMKRFVTRCSDGDLLGGKNDNDGKEVKRLKKFISSRQISLIKMIVEMVESEKKERPIRSLEELALGMAKFENLSEEDKVKVKNKDNGFYIKNVEYVVHNQTLDTISSKLKAITDGK